LDSQLWTAFDLATLNGRSLSVVRCSIFRESSKAVQSWLSKHQRSLSGALTVGNVLSVQGLMAIDDNGLLVLQVEKIAENFTPSGPMQAQDRVNFLVP
jgi:hypothetical protein